jgi:hypothetical protein
MPTPMPRRRASSCCAGDFLLHWFLWALSPIEHLLVRLRSTPDAMNLAGLVFGLASGLLIGLGQLQLGGWAIVMAGICDIMDGRLARAFKVASPYGKFIDSTLDRFVETFPGSPGICGRLRMEASSPPPPSADPCS